MSDALGKMYAHQLVMTQRLGRSGLIGNNANYKIREWGPFLIPTFR